MAHTLEELRKRDAEYIRMHRLGEGAMAVTYLGVKRRGDFERRFALKEIKEEYWADDEFRAKFLEEAEIAASLRHSNIVSVIDVNYELGRMVLELVDGVDLWRLLMSTPEQQLRQDVVQFLAVQLCRALTHLHSRRRRGMKSGVVHRDVSPSNVLISYDGDIKLTDFGLATIIKGHEAPYSKVVRGTVPYLSPEQTRAKPLDGRSDLYSLSVLLYEMLTSQRPFDRASDDATILAIRAGSHRHLSEFANVGPRAFIDFVERNLSVDPDDRYPSADACLDALEQLSVPIRHRELGALARRTKKPETIGDKPFHSQTERLAVLGRRRAAMTRWAAMTGGLAVLGAAGFSVMTTLSRPTSAPAPTTSVKAKAPAMQEPAKLTSTAPSIAPELNPPEAAPAEPSQPTASVTAQPASATAASDTSPRTASAKLKISTEPLPLGLVWVDGRARGRAPVELTMRPGKHEVSAGRTAPDHTTTLLLRPGESRMVIVDLGAPAEVE